MSATLTAAPLTGNAAYLLLSDAHERLLAVIAVLDECGDCKASAGWCDRCGGLFLASEQAGLAKARARQADAGEGAQKLVENLMGRLTDGTYGDAYEIAFGVAPTVTAGGVR